MVSLVLDVHEASGGIIPLQFAVLRKQLTTKVLPFLLNEIREEMLTGKIQGCGSHSWKQADL
jgi:hypothetical protein